MSRANKVRMTENRRENEEKAENPYPFRSAARKMPRRNAAIASVSILFLTDWRTCKVAGLCISGPALQTGNNFFCENCSGWRQFWFIFLFINTSLEAADLINQIQEFLDRQATNSFETVLTFVNNSLFTNWQLKSVELFTTSPNSIKYLKAIKVSRQIWTHRTGWCRSWKVESVHFSVFEAKVSSKSGVGASDFGSPWISNNICLIKSWNLSIRRYI